VSESDFTKLLAQVNSLSNEEAFSHVVRWFLADRLARKVSPFQTATVTEYIRRRIDENIRPGLEQVIRLDPANSLALARLAKAILGSDASPQAKADASNLARLALRFDPEQNEAREVLVWTESNNSTVK
jgi:hypothetical protein